MSELSIDDFDDYMHEVHGHHPFPWQRRLLRLASSEGRWPDILDLPTGTGKTAAIDIALFHLALTAEQNHRTAPLRIVVVVDRRTIVDQTHRRACRIQEALSTSTCAVVRSVRERLAGLSSTADPLQVAVLRGGIARDDAWAGAPDQPLVAVSTVDQVGSRLLYRGYGVSSSMRPVHAGLLGNDTLLLMDEVHLSRPFCQTLVALGRYRGWAEAPLPERWQVVQMSATLDPQAAGCRFGLDAEDREHPVLRRRLEARKPTALQLVNVVGDVERRRATFARACADAALGAVEPGATVAVVVNRVQTARDVFELLKQEDDGTGVELVTGRMRPLDRDRLEQRITPLVAAGRSRDGSQRPLILVATQCIEAGADFDFDVLVTECASIDALRQRFGRLNRLGDREQCRGVIMMRSDGRAEDDPVYGRALASTWEFLEQHIGFDFGLSDATPPDVGLLSPLADAPVLLPAHLDTWVQTSPSPWPDPEVALWLHGPERGEPEVQLVWRSDLSEALLDDEVDLELLRGRIEVCPPSAIEALSLPLGAASGWLRRRVEDDGLADVEGRRREELDAQDAGRGFRRAIAWRQDGAELVRGPGDIRPGDTLLVPSSYGGISAGTWDPRPGASPVGDLGDLAFFRRRGRPILRLNMGVLRDTLGADVSAGWARPPEMRDADDPDGSADRDREEVTTWLEGLGTHEQELPTWMAEVVRLLAGQAGTRRGLDVVRQEALGGEPAYFTILGRRTRRVGLEATTETDTASLTGVQVTLRAHNEGVASKVRHYGRRAGFPEEILDDLEAAARVHDVGKADHRFQQLLQDGSPYKAALAPELMAKSGMPPGDRARQEHARRRSGYPAGCRHEVMSVALLESGADLLASRFHDPDLALHLIGSHHGRCRPLAPVVLDEPGVEVVCELEEGALRARSNHGLARLDSGVGDRFWRCVRRYGWFGVAWLEALLRLADHRCSEEEQLGGAP